MKAKRNRASARHIIELAIICVIFALIFHKLTVIFKVKQPNQVYNVVKTVAGFYQEPRQTIDVVFLGSSHIAVGVSPLCMWKENGISSYSLATPVQSTLSAYYLLRDAAKYQNLRVVLIESSLLFKEEDIDSREETYRWVLDNMPFSMNKLQAVADIIKRSENQSFISYIFPLLRYHDRWAYLNAQDLQSSPALEHSLKGVGLQWWSSSDDAVVNDEICQGNCSIAAFSDYYMSRIAELCAERGIQLVLIQPPYSDWQAEKDKQAADWAAAHQATYIDYNTAENLAATGIVFNSDFVDSGKHLNTLGAEKLSIPLGAYLANTFSLPDHRGDPAYAAWDADYAYYVQLKRAGVLAATTSLPDYLALLAQSDYIVAISAVGGASASLSDEDIAGLRALGLGAALQGHPSWPYLAVIDGQEVIYEKASEQPLTYQYTSPIGINLAITSGASDAGGTTSIRVDRSEYARQQSGLNIVVYDKSMGKVSDSVHFDIAAPAPIAQR